MSFLYSECEFQSPHKMSSFEKDVADQKIPFYRRFVHLEILHHLEIRVLKRTEWVVRCTILLFLVLQRLKLVFKLSLSYLYFSKLPVMTKMIDSQSV